MAERKTGKKKGAAKGGKGSKPGVSRPKKPSVKKTDGAGPGSRALYVLVIMVLVTMVALLASPHISDVSRFWEKAKKAMTFKNSTTAPEKNSKEEKGKIPQEKKDQAEAVSKEETQKTEKTVNEIDAKIYFVRVDDVTEKTFLSPVKRKVRENDKIEESLKHLIRGASADEKRKGYLSAVPGDLKIHGVAIKNGIAEIDFNSAIEYGATGNILVNRIEQIVYTATQFNGIDSVIIKINGKRRKTLGADGLAIDGPLHRRE